MDTETMAAQLAASLLVASVASPDGADRWSASATFTRAIERMPDAPDGAPWIQFVAYRANRPRVTLGRDWLENADRAVARASEPSGSSAHDDSGHVWDGERVAAAVLFQTVRLSGLRALAADDSTALALRRALRCIREIFDADSGIFGFDLRVWIPGYGRLDVNPAAVAQCLTGPQWATVDPRPCFGSLPSWSRTDHDHAPSPGGAEPVAASTSDGACLSAHVSWLLDEDDDDDIDEATDDRSDDDSVDGGIDGAVDDDHGEGPEPLLGTTQRRGSPDPWTPRDIRPERAVRLAPSAPTAPLTAETETETETESESESETETGVPVDLDAPPPATPRPWDADIATGRWRQYRLPLGRDLAGRVVWAPHMQPIVCDAGGPRSGKTTSLAIPALAAHPGPTLVISARPDILEATYASRSRRGRVAVFNPSGFSTSHRTSRYDLLRDARSWRGARQLAEHLTMSAPRRGIIEADFWFTKAAQLLAPLLLAAAANGYTIEDVLRWVKTQEEYEVRALLAAIPGADGELAMQNFDAVVQIEHRARSSIYTTADAAMAVFDLDTVTAAIGAGFDDSFLVAEEDEAPTLYAIAPATEQASIAPIMSLVIVRAIRAAVAHHLATGGPARLLVLVDEAGNVGSVPGLAELTTTAAGCGIQLLIIFHGDSQIEKLYGSHDAETIVDHSNLVFLRGGSRSSGRLLESISPEMAPGEGLRALRGLPRGRGIFVMDLGDPQELQLLSTWHDPDLAASLL